jgi:hypothetical protein
MGKALMTRLCGNIALVAILAFSVAGCTTSDTGGLFSGFNTAKNNDAPPPPKISDRELSAYCPPVMLRDGTAYYDTYEKGGQNDPARIIYQASLTDTTRTCQHTGGNLVIDVAAAGKIVPGPKVKAGTITMPIRVAVVLGDKVLFSKLEKYPVDVADMNAATQFVFNERGVTVPDASLQSIRIYVGYDEGTPAKSPSKAKNS